MNKILAVSILLGVTVMMMGSVLPTMAQPITDGKADPCRVGEVCQDPKKQSTPLKFTKGCLTAERGQVCVAVDHDDDGICDSKPVKIPTTAAKKLGINDSCTSIRR